jgi:hypothetical protein
MERMREQMMAQIREQMQNMPPEQRRQMEEQMGRMGMEPPPQAAKPPQIVAKPTGRSGVVNGVVCEIVEVYADETPVRTMCVADPKALGLPQSDYRTLMAMNAFMKRLSEISMATAGPAAAPNPAGFMQDSDGLPVRMTDVASGSTIELNVSTGQHLGSDLFSVPPGFQQFQMPQAPPQGGYPPQGGRMPGR